VLGGILIIAAILAILVVIAAEVFPLFRSPSATLVREHPATPGGAAAAGDSLAVDEYRELALQVSTNGQVRFAALRAARAVPDVPVPDLADGAITSVVSLGKGAYALGTSDGRAIPLTVQFGVSFEGSQRTVTPQPAFGPPLALDPDGKRPVGGLAAADAPGGRVTVALLGPQALVMHSVVEKKALIGESRKEVSLQPVPLPPDRAATALRLDGRAEDLFVGTSRGEVVHYDLRDRGAPRLVEVVDVASRSGLAVSVLAFLIGDRTLVVGDAAGGVSTWQVVPGPQGGQPRLTRINQFAAHRGPVRAIAASARDKGFATADETGEVRLHYGTSGATLLSLQAGEAVQALAFAPKGDGVLARTARGQIAEWQVENPHPEVTLKTLFGRVWYEGYSRPEYVWQSTGGTDDFEAKFSLTPLIYGTLKGTFYALLFAVPLAILAAAYVSEFTHPAIKAYVKPAVEIMAALPSVVLGFLAGLWLAPMVERIVPGLFLLPLVEIVAILAALLAWRLFPLAMRRRLPHGAEAFLLVPVVILGAWAAFALGGLVEARLLSGDYRGWLLSALGLTYDQRNSLVVGVAMGFAVIPLIFTITEDALANVPQHLRAGSLALGATRWQTAMRVVLPTASPGIFSAVMIGFGRAVGETMIVLMATGNTPVMDANIFSGFRALSANIAVELPEAPEGGTLFRVLFLAAFLLFCLTFVVNTLAEIVRLRLRRRYRYL
jgi:phosphate transport system permease protein